MTGKKKSQTDFMRTSLENPSFLEVQKAQNCFQITENNSEFFSSLLNFVPEDI